MKKYFLILYIIFSQTVHSLELADCVAQASKYGIDLSAPRIDTACNEIVKMSASTHSIDTSLDQSIKAFGVSNLIFTEYKKEVNGEIIQTSGLISGFYTGLNKVKAIDIDEQNEMIYVLNEAKDSTLNVISVEANKTGALAARAKLYSNDIQGATNLRADRKNDHLYVTGPNWIKVFNIDAHHRSSIPNQSVKVIKTLSGNSTGLENVIDLVIFNNKIYVLEENKISVFPQNFQDGDIFPQKNINLNNLGLKIEIENDKVVIYFQDNSKAYI